MRPSAWLASNGIQPISRPKNLRRAAERIGDRHQVRAAVGVGPGVVQRIGDCGHPPLPVARVGDLGVGATSTLGVVGIGFYNWGVLLRCAATSF